jgi:hypothetical protein
MLVRIDSDEIEKLEITPNQYCLAYAIYSGDKRLFLQLKKIYDFKMNQAMFKEDVYVLLSKGYLINENDNPYKIVFGKSRIDKINFNVAEAPEILEEPEVKDEFICELENTGPEGKGDDLDEWELFVVKFREVFPKGASPNGVYVRSSFKDCNKKLTKFRSEYPEFDQETIIKATEKYVKRYAMQGYKFMKTASYFIMKDGESTLAAECESISDSDNGSNGNSLFMSGI